MDAVCLLSGGMDSTTLAYYARRAGCGILALHINYGQRTEKKERAAARKISEILPACEFVEVDLSYLRLFGASSLTDHRIDVEVFDESRACLPNTYVPFRNGNLLSIATSYAEARGAGAIFIGVQAQDYSGYPDCRPAFIEAFQEAVRISPRRPEACANARHVAGVLGGPAPDLKCGSVGVEPGLRGPGRPAD